MADEGGGGGAKEEVEGEREVEGKGTGVLLGMKLAVSCLFSSDDQTLAASILQQQGGDTCVCTCVCICTCITIFLCALCTTMYVEANANLLVFACVWVFI